MNSVFTAFYSLVPNLHLSYTGFEMGKVFLLLCSLFRLKSFHSISQLWRAYPLIKAYRPRESDEDLSLCLLIKYE